VTAATPTGVLVMAHGTPGSLDGLESFYTSIRGGRPPPPDLLAELEDRYRAIGGVSPLAEITGTQVARLAAELETRAPGRYVVGYGAKHVEPSIEAGMAALRSGGVGQVVGIVLTPQESSLGSGSYLDRAAAAAGAPAGTAPVGFVAMRSWHRTDGLADLLAERTAQALATLDPAARRRVALFFTAHSLPERALAPDDPYPRQVAESAADVASRLSIVADDGLEWSVAWQSAGRTPDPWLGPSLLDEVETAAARGVTAVVVCPVGFVADHLEVLYDLDVEAAHAAASHDMAFARTASLNDDPRFITVLARAVEAAVDPSGAPLTGAADGAGNGAAVIGSSHPHG
jgi:protoporphyrin/coproporphyrin ferrochelatase